MKELKVLLGDLRHHTVGSHSSYVPVGVGYISTYLQRSIPSINFKIQIVTNTDEAFDLIDNWKPDILGFSSYIWNSNLSYRACEYAKEKNKNALTIMGGPEFPSGTGAASFSQIIKDECLDYLKEKSILDYYCYSDGETSFSSVVQEYINSNFSTIKMRNDNIAANGAMSLTNDKEKLLIGDPITRLGIKNKVDGRDCVPSPYLNGALDKFLNGKFIPSFETARGCPFMCAFCDQGLDETKIVSYSTKRMTQELDYVAEKINKFSGTKSIAFHDSNWGMYKKDLDLSDHILKLIDQYDWPGYIEISTPKNKRQQILDIDKKLKNRVGIALSQQSMSEETLKLIKRENLKKDEYINFVKELESRGKICGCELIIPLPNETKQSYFESTKILLDCGVNIGTYTLMMLQGAELGRVEAVKKYGMKSKWRLVPRDFGEYRGKKIFDIEKVCIANNTMPYEDYLECRRFSFLLDFFSYSLFSPIRRLLEKDLDISYYEFLFSAFNNLEKDIKNIDIKNPIYKIAKIYSEFSFESEKELFDSKEDIYNFYSKDENYKKLLNSELGDNLLRKYAAKTIAEALDEVIDFSINTILKIMEKKTNANQENTSIINSTRLWLKNLYIFNAIFDWDNEKKEEPIISLDYDIPNWFKTYNESIYNFKKKTNYKMQYNEKNEQIKNEIISLFGNTDKNFALGKYFHQIESNIDTIMKSSIKLQ
jgi:radical SAM superfamily enzyme YgiQ (UPF0313 family)